MNPKKGATLEDAFAHRNKETKRNEKKKKKNEKIRAAHLKEKKKRL